MSFDQNNDYSAGGPGAKRRRERLTVASIPKRIAKPKPYLRKPTNEKRKGSNDEMSDGYRMSVESNNAFDIWCSITTWASSSGANARKPKRRLVRATG